MNESQLEKRTQNEGWESDEEEEEGTSLSYGRVNKESCLPCIGVKLFHVIFQ
jgi:hypothetical protein